jgi:hypothetical protein
MNRIGECAVTITGFERANLRPVKFKERVPAGEEEDDLTRMIDLLISFWAGVREYPSERAQTVLREYSEYLKEGNTADPWSVGAFWLESEREEETKGIKD